MKHRTTYQMLIIERAFTPEYRQTLRHLSKPARVCGKRTPQDLNDLSIGELLQLQVSGDARAMVVKFAEVILKVGPQRALRERGDKMLGFIFWVESEIKRINKLFEDIRQSPTPDEIKAGINNLNFGVIGIIDWYALRMGYKDHDEAADVPWVRVRECMRIDNERAAFERRLRDVVAKNSK